MIVDLLNFVFLSNVQEFIQNLLAELAGLFG